MNFKWVSQQLNLTGTQLTGFHLSLTGIQRMTRSTDSIFHIGIHGLLGHHGMNLTVQDLLGHHGANSLTVHGLRGHHGTNLTVQGLLGHPGTNLGCHQLNLLTMMTTMAITTMTIRLQLAPLSRLHYF